MRIDYHGTTSVDRHRSERPDIREQSYLIVIEQIAYNTSTSPYTDIQLKLAISITATRFNDQAPAAL